MDLFHLLTSYQPKDPVEIVFKQRMLSFLSTSEDAFHRSNLNRHFTASAWLEDAAGKNILLMHHSKLDKWFQLGGHCDGDTNLLAVAIKEALEESGLAEVEPVSREIFDIDIHTIPARANEPAHDHYDVRFHLRVKGKGEISKNHESRELRWISRDGELPTDSLSVTRMFHKWNGKTSQLVALS